MTKQPDIVPQSTARKVLGIENRQILGNWIKRGRISAHNIHGEKWVSLEDCRAWMKNPARKKGRPHKKKGAQKV